MAGRSARVAEAERAAVDVGSEQGRNGILGRDHLPSLAQEDRDAGTRMGAGVVLMPRCRKSGRI